MYIILVGVSYETRQLSLLVAGPGKTTGTTVAMAVAMTAATTAAMTAVKRAATTATAAVMRAARKIRSAKKDQLKI